MAKREFTGVGPRPRRPEGWNPDELHEHVRGRAEATVKVMIAVAALRSLDRLPGGVAVSVTGARWQDWRGTRDQPRAHRFPCNPLIGGRDLLSYALNLKRLSEFLQNTLASTDALPFHVNYADRLFEELGGVEASRKGIEAVASRQKLGKPVHHAVVQTAWRQTVWVDYQRAWESVESKLQDRINRESATNFLERVAGFRRNAPTDSIETVMDVAYDAKRSTELVSSPAPLSLPGFEAILQQLR